MKTVISSAHTQSGSIALRISTTLIFTFIASLVWTSALQAQETQEAQGVLEEVIVTAERREQSLQDVPVSMTVLTSEALGAVDDVLDIQQVAPSVAINTYNRSTFINIRGVGIAQSAPTSTPGVAYYVDGVFIPHEHLISQSFYDLESIEVLRGPQGTLTGQNSTGGAIYVRTPTPDFEEFSGYVDQTIGDYEWARTVAAVNLPFGDTFAVRLAGIYETRGSYTDNIGPSPSQPGSGDMTGIRASMLFQPTDSMRFNLKFQYFDRESDYNAVKNRNDAVTDDPFTIEEDAISFLNQDGYMGSLEGFFDLTEGLQLRVITSYLDADNEDQADGDRTATALPVPPNLPTNGANTALYPGRVGLTTQSFETSVTEVNLLSTGDGPVQWVVGAFYMDETTPVSVLRDNRNTVDFVQSNSTILAEAINTSKSVFGQVDWALSDNWALDAGLRYSDDKQDYTRFALPGPPPPGCFPCTNTADSSETTGRVGVKFFGLGDTMLYGTLSKGYKAGGVNLDPRLDVFGPETNEVIELGFKSTIADGRLRLNGAVFYSDYQGIQLSALTQVGPTLLPNTLNAAPADILGGELELLGQFDRLGFNLGVSVLDTEFTEDKILTNSLTNRNELVPAGAELPFAPDFTLTGGIQYDFDVGGMTLTPRAQVSYIGEQLATPFPDPATIVPSRTVADLRLTLQANDVWQVEGFFNNVFDETYIAVQLQDASSAQGGMIFGPPRHYGLRLRYSF
jgi:iron complex outermembrane receptor protein